MTIKSRTWWIVLESDGEGQIGRCLRCMKALKLDLPMPLLAASMYLEAFVEEHSACKSGVDTQIEVMEEKYG